MPDPKPTRWFHHTPDRLVIGLLVVEGTLLASDRLHSFPKGYAVLLAAATVALAVLFLLLWFADSLLFRRRFQFGIRSLLLFTLAIATVCSWLTNDIRWARTQRETLAEIDNAKYLVKHGKHMIPFPAATYSYLVEELGWPTLTE